MRTLNILLEITIYSGILLCAIMLIKQGFKDRMSPFLHLMIWGLLIARLLIPVTLESSVHLFVIPAESSVATTQQAQTLAENTNAADITSVNQTQQASAGQQTVNATTPSTATQNAAASQKAITLSTEEILLVVWLTGAGFGLVYLAALYALLRRRIRRNAQTPSKRLLALFAEVKDELNIRSNVRIIGQCEYGTPAVLFPNTVLMPINTLVSMRDEEIKYVLRHELMHFKRGDHILGLLLSVINAVYWFNPVVWLAFKQIRADMETACDSDVVRVFSSDEKTTYAAIILSLFSKKQYGNLVLGMVQGDTRKIAEKRIRGVFMSRKSNRKVKLTAVALASLLLFTCFTTACQPTPESDIVIGKNDDTLESAIHTEALPGTTIEYEEHWTEELQSADKEVKILINAPVEVPNVTSASVVSIKPHYFNDEEAKEVVSGLFGDLQLYQPTVNKSELEQYIISLRADIESLKEDGTYSELHMGSGAGEPADDVEGTIEFYEEKLAQAEQQYNEASDNPEKITEIELTQSEDGTTGFYAQDGQDIPATFDAYNNTESNTSFIEYRNWHGNIYSDTGELQTDNGLALSLTPKQAQQKAVDFMKSLGLEDVSVSSVHGGTAGSGKYCYIITLERMIGGIPCHTITEHTGTAAFGVDGAEYREPWNPEKIEIMIDDIGIIGFKWENPPEFGETINSNVALFSYDEIKDIASAQLSRLFTAEDLVARGYDDKTISINLITFGMMRIAKKNSTNEYYYLPVWDFLGHYGSGNGGSEISFLTINALDGSTVDRGLGY